MAVYTRIDPEQVKAFLRAHPLGDYVSHEGITQGVENTNYLLTTTTGKYILTLVEKRTPVGDLPFIFSYMKHLAAAGIVVPNVMAQGEIAGKPAAVITFLEGKSIYASETTPGICTQIGTVLATMHKASANFVRIRENPVGPPEWGTLFNALRNEIDPATSEAIEQALHDAQAIDWKSLPNGAIHADLFRDNAFFEKGRLSGVIDFYFACTAPYAYDLAITMNAWCFNTKNQPVDDHIRALVDAYQKIRPLNAAERAAFPALRRAAALRILLTRLYDWFFTESGAQVTKHDPMEYFAKLQAHNSWL